MAGFRTFATGEVLTAANVNDFLMKQSVMVFDDATARTTALGAEVAEGMLTFNKDTAQLEVYDGTNFVVAAPPQNLVAVKSAIFTGVQTDNVVSGGNVAVTDLTITHALTDAANKVVLYATVNGSSQFQTSTTTFGAAITAGGVLLGLGDADGTRVRVASAAAGSLNTGATRGLDSLSLVAVSTPGVTTSVTYGVNVINVTDSTQAINVNKSSGDANDALHGRAACFLLLMEVKV